MAACLYLCFMLISMNAGAPLTKSCFFFFFFKLQNEKLKQKQNVTLTKGTRTISDVKNNSTHTHTHGTEGLFGSSEPDRGSGGGV